MFPLSLEGLTLGGKSQAIVITSEDRRAANEMGALLGVSGDELTREFMEEWEQLTPEEQREFEQLIDQANAVLPELHASLDRIERTLECCRTTVCETRESMSAMSERCARIEDALTGGTLG